MQLSLVRIIGPGPTTYDLNPVAMSCQVVLLVFSR